MSIVEDKCPHCGSTTNSKIGRDEYRCGHCGATFHFVDASRREVIHLSSGHNCPECGKPVKIGEGYKCTECGKEGFCKTHIKHITPVDSAYAAKDYPENRGKYGLRYVCWDCWNALFPPLKCDECGRKMKISCLNCGARACEVHDLKFWDHLRGWRYCSNCEPNYYNATEVCDKCVVVKHHLLGKDTYHCPKCGELLKHYCDKETADARGFDPDLVRDEDETED